MIIDAIEVKNLLSFEDLEIPLAEGLNVIVGPNDIGKTNLVRLVKLLRDAVLMVPSKNRPVGLAPRYVRRYGPGTGRLGLKVRFTEQGEKDHFVLFLRTIAAEALERVPDGNAGSLSGKEKDTFFATLACKASELITEDATRSLFTGRLIMEIDARPPTTWAIAYEFEHGGETATETNGETYHVMINGHSVISGTVARGPFIRSSTTLPNQSSSSFSSFEDLLPKEGSSMQWTISSDAHKSGRPLALELARTLDLADDRSQNPDFLAVARRVIRDKIVITDNLRRPPRSLYSLTEADAELPVEDGGDLPLALYLMKNGSSNQRSAHQELQKAFSEMTGKQFDLSAAISSSKEASMVSSDVSPACNGELRVELQVGSAGIWTSLEYSGAGLWEALFELAVAASSPGKVVLLDEPATHLHSSWQRLLLDHLKVQNQAIVITHSPVLVPASTPEDFYRVTRLALSGAKVVPARVDEAICENWKERWHQIFAWSTDARDILFNRGVLLVEGDTEVGAFRCWFNDPKVVDNASSSLEGRNIAVVSVDGDANFGPWVSYLNQMRVPWAILADGPVLSPKYSGGMPLYKQLSFTLDGGDAPPQLEDGCIDASNFVACKTWWEKHGVFTVATSFGLDTSGKKVNDSSGQSGEIEAWFLSLDSDLWEGTADSKSKIRRGYRFADQLDLDVKSNACNETARNEIQNLWMKICFRLEGKISENTALAANDVASNS